MKSGWKTSGCGKGATDMFSRGKFTAGTGQRNATSAQNALLRSSSPEYRGDVSSRYCLGWLPPLVWMAVIFAASTDLMSAEHTSRYIGPILRWFAPDISGASVAAVQLVVRKAAHLTEYAVLSVLLLRAVAAQTAGELKVRALQVLLICAFYAAFDEFHQSFVASRTASPVDVMIDTCGAGVGLLLYVVLAKSKP